MQINWGAVGHWLLESIIGLVGWVLAGLKDLSIWAIKNFFRWVFSGGIYAVLFKFCAVFMMLGVVVAKLVDENLGGAVFLWAAIPIGLIGLIGLVVMIKGFR